MNTLGKISLLLSLFCFLLTLGFQMALPGLPVISWGIGFGLVFLVFSMLINFKYLRALLKSESLHFLGKSLLWILLIFFAVFFLNFIVYKKNLRVDLTSNKIHSLSDLTQALFKAIPEDVHFYYFHVGNSKVRGFEAAVRDFLHPYLELNSRVHFESHSVFQRPDLAEKFKTGNEESALFVEYKGRIQRVSELTEPAVTNAILKLTKNPKVIYFLEGHDERKINDDSTFGLKGVHDQLERLHYKVDSLSSLKSLPEDMAILVIMAPRLAFTVEEIKQLKAYLSSGGMLLLGLDPGESPNLKSFLSDYGIDYTGTFVYSRQAQAGQSPWLVLTHKGQNTHELSQTLSEGESPAFFVASVLQTKTSQIADLKVQPILDHLPNSEARVDLVEDGAKKEFEELTAAALVEGVGDEALRMVVVGDSDFMTNQYYARPGNFDFILSLFAYLSRDEDLLKMKVPQPQTTYLILTQSQLNLYFLFYVLPLSLIFFVFALFFKLRRLF